MRNALTIDVEDYFQVAALEPVLRGKSWEGFESRVEANTDTILAVLDEARVKATFFVLGWVAERYPQIVTKIDQAGHEVASHGYSHKLIYTQTQEEFREETFQSKTLLEDIVQKPVLGYRAASYSITEKNLWALDIINDAGFLYDSSIYPVKHDRYGIPGANPYPHVLQDTQGRDLVEFPVSSINLAGYRLPIGGGGYFRLYPYWFTRLMVKLYLKLEKQPFHFYLHPWEVDAGQPYYENASRLSKFRHYNNLDKCEDRLRKLIKQFEFTTVKDVLEESGFLNNAQVRSKGKAA